MRLSLSVVIIESALKSWLSSTALKLKFSIFQLHCVVLPQYFEGSKYYTVNKK